MDPIQHASRWKRSSARPSGRCAQGRALVTIGSASMKWARSWRDTDIDFYTFHINDRVNLYWPYNQSPADYGITTSRDHGGFPDRRPGDSRLPTLLESWYSQGYAGAVSWAYSDATTTGARRR